MKEVFSRAVSGYSYVGAVGAAMTLYDLIWWPKFFPSWYLISFWMILLGLRFYLRQLVDSKPLHYRGATALIIGGTSGIGFEFAKLFARDGYKLVLVAKDTKELQVTTQELQRIGAISVEPIAMDPSQPTALEELVVELKRRNINVDFLINSAIVGKKSLFWEMAPEANEEHINLNCRVVTQLTRLLLPDMIKLGRGKVLNVGSIAAFFPGPLFSVYIATVSYLLALSEALAEELRGTGVTCTILCPGPLTKAQTKNPLISSSAREAALEGYKSIFRGDTVTIPGWTNWAMVAVSQFLPLGLRLKLSKMLALDISFQTMVQSE